MEGITKCEGKLCIAVSLCKSRSVLQVGSKVIDNFLKCNFILSLGLTYSVCYIQKTCISLYITTLFSCGKKSFPNIG
jgi:hypothetical protein